MNSLLKITLFGIIAIALLLSGCIEEENGLQETKPEQTPETEQPTAQLSCEEITEKTEREDCYWKKAVEKKDLSECEKIETELKNLYCQYGAAIAKGDPELCDDLVSPRENEEELRIELFKKQCRELVEVDCEQIEMQKKDECYSILAFYTQKKSYCEKIEKEDFKELCISRIKDRQDYFCEDAKSRWTSMCGMIALEETCSERDISGDGVPDCEWVNNKCQRIQGQPIAGNPPECR